MRRQYTQVQVAVPIYKSANIICNCDSNYCSNFTFTPFKIRINSNFAGANFGDSDMSSAKRYVTQIVGASIAGGYCS